MVTSTAEEKRDQTRDLRGTENSRRRIRSHRAEASRSPRRPRGFLQVGRRIATLLQIFRRRHACRYSLTADTAATTTNRLHRKRLMMRERNSESYLKSELRTSKVLTLCSRSLETRSRPRFLAATLATLPSMSLFPKAPFDLSVCPSMPSAP